MKLPLSLTRYFTKSFLFWLFVFLFGILVLIFLFDFSELTRRASSRPHVTLGLITQMALLRLPHLGQQLLPFAVLFSTMFCLWQFNRHNEIIVARAAGVSIWQMLTPLMCAAAFIGALDLTIVNPMSSAFMARYTYLNEKIFLRKAGQFSLAESGIWFRKSAPQNTYVLRVGHITPHKLEVKDVTILEYSNKDRLKNLINAEFGQFHTDGLMLTNVWTFPVDGTPQQHSVYRYTTDLSLSQLQNSLLTTEVLSFWTLPRMIHLMQKSGLTGHKYLLHWHSLIARALWLVTMVIIAAIFSLRPIRQGGTVISVISGTTVGFMLYFLKDITYAMGQSATLPLILAAWAPFGLSTLMAVAILLHLEDG